MIQILTYSGNEEKLRGEGIKLHKIHDAEALDSFETNIISLQDDDMWITRSGDTHSKRQNKQYIKENIQH